MSQSPTKVRTCLWFNANGEEAAELYTSLLPDSRIDTLIKPDPNGPAVVVEFTLAGVPYTALNGGPMYSHTPAASIAVLTRDEQETDRLWTALTADGGEEGMCGWLVDRFGVSWQIIPDGFAAMMSSDDQAAAGRVREAMMAMKKLDIAKLEAAFAGR